MGAVMVSPKRGLVFGRDKLCSVCKGTGEGKKGKPCEACKGSGVTA